ncbi:MAG TPA: hypothetical protein VMZ53_21770 [Kofleriaceae bacterium]|nr:hypothetical protein [Kofleriaceae bacterium]
MSNDDDANKLAEISRELPPLDIDDAAAQRIAQRARASVGRGPSPTRFIEPVLVGLLVLSVLVWTILKLIEVLG